MEWVSVAMFFVGVVSRILVPWLLVRQQDPENASWDWRYVWPMLLSVVIIVLLLPLLVADLDALLSMPWQPAWLAGWGAADIGRKVAKRFQDDGAE